MRVNQGLSPAAMGRRLVIFDLDRTLLREDTAGLLMRLELALGLTSWARVLIVLYWRVGYRLGYIHAERIAQRVLVWNKGRMVSDLREQGHTCFERYIRPRLLEQALESVKQWQSAGATIVIATASTQYIAEPVAQFLGVDALLCSRLQSRAGVLTGALNGALCYGSGKARAVQTFATERGFALGDAVFYSDSITDLPTLLSVGSPRTVNPDARLWWRARRRGWPVLRW